MTMSDAEHAAFLRGFDLAQPPGRQEIDALERAKEVLPVDGGQLRVAVSRDLAEAILTETEPLPESLAGPTWIGFIRGLVAKAGGATGYVPQPGRA